MMTSPPDSEGWFLCWSGPISIITDKLTEEADGFAAAVGWYGEHSPVPQTSGNMVISQFLDAGAVLEHFHWDDGAGREALVDQLAGVAIHLLRLATVEVIDREKAVLDKLRVNCGRPWVRD